MHSLSELNVERECIEGLNINYTEERSSASLLSL